MSGDLKKDFPDERFMKYYRALDTLDPKTTNRFFKEVFNAYPQSPLFYFKQAELQFKQNDLKNSLENLTYALDLYTENLRTNRSYLNKAFDGDLKFQLFFLKIQVLDKISAPINEIKQALLELKEESERNPSESVDEINKIIKKYSEKYKLNLIKSQFQTKRSFEKAGHFQEINFEAKEVFELMEASNDQNFMKEEGFPVNVISMNWFIKWKRFTNFHLISGERFDECSSMDLSQFNEKEVPGLINQDDILSNEKILIDPDKIKNYCNMILKTGIEENKDFIIVSHKIWKYLFKIYGGQEIKRYIVSVNDDSNLTHVELNLKKVKYFFLLSYKINLIYFIDKCDYVAFGK